MPASDITNGTPYEVIPGDKLNEYGLMQLDDDEQYFPIAVVGIGCRFPGAYDLRQYREVLMKQLTTYKPLPENGRWNRKEWAENPQPHMPGYIECPSAGFLDTKRYFDCAFFNTSPKESLAMEPQQHDAMEVTHEALEDGGFTKEHPLPQNTAVFLSMRMGETVAAVAENPNLMSPYILTGGAHTTLANRVSFFWNLRGASMGVDGADAASTHSVHFGIWALWNRESDAVIAGGMNGIIQTFYQLAFDDAGALSKSGSCRPFDADADGKVRSEGAAVVILRPLADAIKDGNHIHCVIRASQMNFSSDTFTLGQLNSNTVVDTLGGTYERFGIPPEKIDFIEAHATGKANEDVMEIKALGNVFKKNENLRVGSCKANLGHADCAAGMSQLIKAALMIGKREFYPQANFSKLPSDVNGISNLQVQTQHEKFQKSKNMMVGIDAFAYTGQVCHMVLEEFKNKVKEVDDADLAGWKFGELGKEGRTVPIVLSAKNQDALKDYVRKWREFEWREDDAQIVASWLATKRDHFNNRLVILAKSAQDFRDKAGMYLEGTPCDEVIEGAVQKDTEDAKLCVVFPGQGQQWWDMGRFLYEHEPVYRKIVDECDRLWKQYSGYSFLEKDRTFVKDKGNANPADIDNILIAQPAIVSNQIGLFELLKHWGIKADCIVGHSLGEVAASYAAGGLTLEECMSSLYVRAYTQTKLAGTGSMAAARLSPKEADDFVSNYDDLYVACYNSTDNVTLAGGTPIIEKLAAENPKKLKIIRVQAAFHTCHLNAVKEEFYDMIQGIIEARQTNPEERLYSTVTKGAYTGPFTPDYWWTNMSEPVFFTQATEAIFKDYGSDILFLELGSAATMLSSVRQSAKKLGFTPAGYVHFGLRVKDDHQSALKGFAQLHTMGVPVQWSGVTRNCARYVPLPTYPFQRTFFELTASKMTDRLLDDLDKSFYGRHGKVNASEHAFLFKMMYEKQHVFPPSAIIEYLAEMCKEDVICMKDLLIQRKLPVLENFTSANDIVYNMIVNACSGDKLMIYNQQKELLATATKLATPLKSGASEIDIEGMKQSFTKMEAEEVYNLVESMGIECEEALRELRCCFVSDGEALGELRPPTNKFECLHTLTLEAATHIAIAAFSVGRNIKSLDKIRYLHASVPRIGTDEQVFVYVKLADWCTESFEVDMYLTTKSGTVLLTAEGCRFTSWSKEENNEADMLYTLSNQISPISLGKKMPVRDWNLKLPQQEFNMEERVSLNQEEVMIRVKAVGNVEGMLQCSGTIEEVGADVTGWKAGDQVISLQSINTFKSLMTCNQARLIAKPEKLSWADASTFGVTYGLAYMTLEDTCQLQADQKVLIYGGDRPSRQIFSSVARSLNADVLLCDSEDAAQVIQGQVDVIINLTDGIPDSVLHMVGDDCTVCSVSFGEQHNHNFALDSHITYCSVNALDCMGGNVMSLRAGTVKAIELLTEGKLAMQDVTATQLPQLPGNKTDDISALTIPEDFQPLVATYQRLYFESGASFVITNAFSGLGMMLAEWLAKRGATHLVLVSNEKADRSIHRLFLRNLKNAGTEVDTILADLSQKESSSRLFNSFKSPAVDQMGIFHLATMANKTTLLETQNLQSELQNSQLPLKYFVTISPGSGLSLSPEDAMAKCLDGLMVELRSKGLRSVNVRLGRVDNFDIVDQNAGLESSLAAQGTSSMDIKVWLSCLEQLLLMDEPPSAAAILNQDWIAAYFHNNTDKPAFESLVNKEEATARSQVKDWCIENMSDVFRSFLAELLLWPLDVIQLDLPLSDLGVDLYITELINRWMKPRYNTALDWQDVHSGMTGQDAVNKLVASVTKQ